MAVKVLMILCTQKPYIIFNGEIGIDIVLPDRF